MMIRAMRVADIAAIAAWIPAVPLWSRYAVTEAQIKAQLEQALIQRDLVLVAEIDHEVNGIAWCLPRGAFGRSVYLRLLGVRNESTGLGIGAALLEEAERQMAAIYPDLFLLVSDFNERAQRFYRKQGYQQVGAVPGYVLPDVTELIFWKSLR